MTVLFDRWQFGVTITYHFLFVPLTIGLAFLVAIMQVLAYRRKDAVWSGSPRLTVHSQRERVHRRERSGLTQVQSPGLPADRPGRPELVNLRMRSAVQTGKLVGSGGLVCVAGQEVTGLPVREERSWT
jgi:Cytochrome bd terminal oxidase subunit I